MRYITFRLAFPCVLSVGLAVAETIAVEGTDSAAIAAALAKANPGDVVELTAGEYTITETVCAKSGVALRGQGADKTILRFCGASPCSMMDLGGCENVEVSGLTLDGEMNPGATNGITAGNARNLRIHHVAIRDLGETEGFGPHGILFSGVNPTRENGVTDSVIENCVLENIGAAKDFGCGIRFSWGSSRNRALNNTITTTGRGGIFADNGSTDLTIRGNTVRSSGGEGLGIEVWGGSDRAVIEDNRIDHWLSIGGCNYVAARRNVVSDTSSTYKFCGIEAIGTCNVITGCVVDGGAKIGLSVSAPLDNRYVFWARNVVRGCNQWGSQLQGEGDIGIAYQYFHACVFEDMPVGVGPVWYPGDEGHGFRVLGKAHHLTFEECAFRNNGRFGVQLVGNDLDCLRFVRCVISGNKGAAVSGPGEYTGLEWTDCVVQANGSDALPPEKPMGTPPTASFDAPASIPVGEVVRFADKSQAHEGAIAARLWDLDDGLPNTDAEPAHTYERPGKYLVTLIVWDDAGRAARAEHTLTVL